VSHRSAPQNDVDPRENKLHEPIWQIIDGMTAGRYAPKADRPAAARTFGVI